MAGTTNNITADDEGPLVNVIAWVFMVIMIMASLTKVGSTLYHHRTLRIDDLLLAMAMTVAVSEQVAYGLGTENPLSDDIERSKYEQTSYASQLLYVLTLYFTKATTAVLIRSFAVKKWVYWAMSCLIYGYLAWTVTSLFVVAFQCSVPRPWDFYGNSCVNMVAFWSFYAAVDILTDMLLIMVPIAVVRKLQTTKSRRVSIISAFTIRFLIIPITVLRVVFLGQTYITDRSSGIDEVRVAIATEVHMHMAIVLACVPFIKHVIDGLQGGIMTSDLLYGPVGVRSNNRRGQDPSSSLSGSPFKTAKPSVDVRPASATHRQESNDLRITSNPEKRSESALALTSEPEGNISTVHTAVIVPSEQA